MERLSNPEVLFGLAVRFFGVFIVLIIVMTVLYLTAWVFQRLEKKEEVALSPADPASSPLKSAPQETPTEAVSTSPGSTVPDEVAIAIALPGQRFLTRSPLPLPWQWFPTRSPSPLPWPSPKPSRRGVPCPFCLLVDPPPLRGNNQEVRGSSWADSRRSFGRPLSHETSPQKANSR